MTDNGYRVTSLDEIGAKGAWIPIRRELGIRAFGVNAWRATKDGEAIIGEHDEVATGHEELYVVLSGSATFTVSGETFDGPTGTIVFVGDPATKRGATANELGTTILSAGAKPGETYTPRPWEENADIIPLFGTGEYALARERIEAARERHPEEPSLIYNLACAEARLGETEAALDHLAQAVERQPQLAELAQTDEDLEAIRREPAFPTA
jgi:tetratricopeptide (TPR) repeat protein